MVAGALVNVSPENNNCAICACVELLNYQGVNHPSLDRDPKDIRLSMHEWIRVLHGADPIFANKLAHSILTVEESKKASLLPRLSEKVIEWALKCIENNGFLSMESVIEYFRHAGVFPQDAQVPIIQFNRVRRGVIYKCMDTNLKRLLEGKPIIVSIFHLNGNHFCAILHDAGTWQTVLEWIRTSAQVVISSDDEMPPAPPAPKADTLLQWGLSQDIVRAWVRNLRPEVRARLLRDARKWLQ